MAFETDYAPYYYAPGAAMAAEAIPFPYLDTGFLVVVHIADATGVETELVPETDYLIGGNGAAGTGTITATAAWPGADLFRITRLTPVVQKVSIPPGQPFPSRVTEQQLDRLTMIAQEQRDGLAQSDARALRVQPGEVAPVLARAADSIAPHRVIGRDPATGVLGEIDLPVSFKGDRGAAGNIVTTLAELKAAPVTDDTLIWGGAPFRWETENAPYVTDEDNSVITTVESNDVPKSVGAWVSSLTFYNGAPTGKRRSLWERSPWMELADFYDIDNSGGDDSLPGMQEAADWVMPRGYRELRVGDGDYNVDGTLLIRDPGGTGLGTLTIKGPEGGNFLGIAQFNHAPGQLRDPIFAVQAMRTVKIIGIRIMGNNVAPSGTGVGNANWRNPDPNAYVSAGCSNSRRAPYVGIAIDVLNGPTPTDPADRYGHGTYGTQGGKQTSSDIHIEACRIQNFVVGLYLGASTGCENHKIKWCHFIENHTAYAGNQTQERNVVFENSDFNGHFVQFDTLTRGLQNGVPPKVMQGIHAKCYRLVQLKGDVGVFQMIGGYLESVATLGIIGDNPSSAAVSATFEGVEISLIGHAGSASETPKDVPFLINAPTTFRDCIIVSQWAQHIIAGAPVTLENVGFRANAAGITSAQLDRFALSVAAGTEGRLTTRQVAQRVYSGTKAFDREQGVSGLPARMLLNNTVSRIRDDTNGRLYKVEPLRTSAGGSVLATRDVTGLTSVTYVNAETVTFGYTVNDDRPMMVGDRLLWRCKTPALPGTTPATHIAPGLEVTGLAGGVATCKAIADLDTTYFPTSAEVIVERFITGVYPTGTVSVGSTDITGVVGAANLRVRDWIQLSDAAAPKYIRVAGISGTTVTMHRQSNVAGAITIFNAKLTEIAA